MGHIPLGRGTADRGRFREEGKRDRMKIGAVFSDYDGTLAPIGVPREESRVYPAVRRAMTRLGKTVPVAIVTAKDFGFVSPRTRFAAAWACVQGLEIRSTSGVVMVAEELHDVGGSLAKAKELSTDGTVLEVKESGDGHLLGYSLDWSIGSRPGEKELSSLLRLARREGFVGMHDDEGYVDVFAQRPQKGRAVGSLKGLLKPKGRVMFIGDSPEDNPAFREADVSLGVDRGQDVDALDCEILLDQRDLGSFLESLVADDMRFYLRQDLADERRT